MPQDYFLRMSTLRKCSRRFWRREKQAGNRETIEQIAGTGQDHVGIPLEIVRRSSPETLLQIAGAWGRPAMRPGSDFDRVTHARFGRSGRSGNPREALIARAQDYALISDASLHPPPKD